MTTQRLLRPSEVMDLLGVSRHTFWRLVSSVDDPLPTIRIGRIYRIDPEKLRAWLARRAT